LKVFGDGSLGGHTAALFEPYDDCPDTTGTIRIHDWVEPTARAAVALGSQVGIHAIGDRANREVIDLLERLAGDGADPAQLRIEHASVLAPDDVHRMARIGITAVVQPAFLASEAGWLETRLGPERLARTYAFRTLRDAGVPLAGSSDCPVEPPHPLWGMAAAVDRAGLVPGQALTPAEALELFTTGAAAVLGEDARLRAGAPASFTVLDRDPTAPGADIRATGVVATWVDGAPITWPEGITTWVA